MYELGQLSESKKEINSSNNLESLLAWREKFSEQVTKVYSPTSDKNVIQKLNDHKNKAAPLWINPYVETWQLETKSSIPDVLAPEFQIDKVKDQKLKKMLEEIKTWKDWYSEKYREVGYGGGY